MKIRKATKKDLKEIGELMRKVFYKSPFNERDSIKAVLKSLNFYFKMGQIYIAEADKKIIGVIVFKEEKYWEGRVIIIEDLAVKKEFEEQNIGKELVDYVESLGKKKKVKSISFSTHKKSSAVKFYLKRGYKLEKNTIFMRKNLK